MEGRNPSKSHSGRDRQTPLMHAGAVNYGPNRKEKAITFSKGAGTLGVEFNESFGLPLLNRRADRPCRKEPPSKSRSIALNFESRSSSLS
ncbi:hypothetical protein AVEN_50136-1 [Araneus ventricosus]|uniref:Uncharacterized protein n=1 Tax=Araneus ventricosus TaxID=182803 RepID=A0A4Y2DC16_ARAVE|nr:hypothetical protein AVEN_50136-1 [Araneus ventricosus]